MSFNDLYQYKHQAISQLSAVDAVSICSRDFNAALTSNERTLIAQMHRRSPSAGLVRQDYRPAAIAREFIAAAADAIAVITDEGMFGGCFADLAEVRATTELPILCKDFIIDRRQIDHARRAGADACLLIVGMLSDRELHMLYQHIQSLGMLPLLEVFDQQDLRRALVFAPEVVLINNRNLQQMTLNAENASKLAEQVPDPVKIIAASGYTAPHQIRALGQRIDAVLIGHALMQAADVTDWLQSCRTGEALC